MEIESDNPKQKHTEHTAQRAEDKKKETKKDTTFNANDNLNVNFSSFQFLPCKLTREKLRDIVIPQLNQNQNQDQQSLRFPFWMRWRLFEAAVTIASLQTTTTAHEPFLPSYSQDEWKQICPTQEHKNRYLALTRGDTRIRCYYHKGWFTHVPFHTINENYVSSDHFSFETRFCFCSPNCAIQYTKKSQPNVLPYYILNGIQAVVLKRWGFHFRVCDAPPMELLYPFSGCPRHEEKDIPDFTKLPARSWIPWIEKLVFIRRDYSEIEASISPELCPSSIHLWNLYLGLNSYLFTIFVPPHEPMPYLQESAPPTIGNAMSTRTRRNYNKPRQPVPSVPSVVPVAQSLAQEVEKKES